jgi:hypothetical protein
VRRVIVGVPHQFAQLPQFAGLLTERAVLAQCNEDFAFFRSVELVIDKRIETFFGNVVSAHCPVLN